MSDRGRRLQGPAAGLLRRPYHVLDEVPFWEAARIVGDRAYENLIWLFAPDKPGEEFWTALREREAALATCPVQRAQQLPAAQRPGR